MSGRAPVRAGAALGYAAGLAAGLATVLAAAPAEARPRRGPAQADSDRVLARMAAHDRLVLWPAWAFARPAVSDLPPATRERLPAPPLTGWGYGGTVPGARPGF
ncbi:hypothetical protein Q8W71_09945 [Methylobacterium sp. NEAU 140]|uniref:hypothetical protein n=1 Tax=Methylobacterium sp. NEAU 140 TaxID=3064945 RepID=UPI002736B847|nr:hypothetical protein [Methylobacterium sp. NEAU 140]MDP4022944.1 hypothetical protein [Methylobacterium sp. NEAU 140]